MYAKPTLQRCTLQSDSAGCCLGAVPREDKLSLSSYCILSLPSLP